MVSCTRCCLQSSMRVVNLFLSLCGIGMIIYTLWLLKKWQDGVALLSTVSSLPRPWFIYTCLAVGIAVSLSTLSGHMVANCISNYTLCIYIVSICSLLFLEVGVIVTIFFRMDWEQKIAKYIDGNHKEFRTFVIFHLHMCRFILIMILVPQINVIVLAIILWGIGTEPSTHCSYLDISDFNHSFLLIPNSPIFDETRQICRKCKFLCRANPGESLLSYIKGLLRMRFQGRISTT
ncbi:tetraspanin-19-like [Corylus avellana]|uniref:tetraspanin-19-like n=1 Tax=Corylus avellana TaxID=13451 RepID=UPI00286C9CD1|nr:tetraspanin-19-like [Corylus avellana]